MERIGTQKIWSYFGEPIEAREASNQQVRGGTGHNVGTYFQLAKKVAELQFLNRDHVLLFRGQRKDHLTKNCQSILKPSLFRLEGPKIPTKSVLAKRFKILRRAEAELVKQYASENLQGVQRVKRHRIIRWAVLQHYDVCKTPLLDVTQSLRIAASFASLQNQSNQAFVFAFGVPNLSGAITASSEAGLQIVRLSSACPPQAVRPHIQEGYLLGEYPEISDINQNSHYSYYEMDFGRRLVAKFRFDPTTFWSSDNYPPAPPKALFPPEHRDALPNLTKKVTAFLESSEP